VSVERDQGVRPSLAELLTLRPKAKGVAARRGRDGLSGPSPSPLRGRGMDYAESRAYTPGDDVRHMDWRLTARSGVAHTKLYQAERERSTLIVADTSASLYFGTRVRMKSVQAARVGALVAWRALADGDRVAILRGSREDPPRPPLAGLRGVLRVLDALVRWYAAPPAGDDGLAYAIDHAARLLRPGARAIVLADAVSVLGIEPRRWQALAAHREIAVVLLCDAVELAPPAARAPVLAAGVRRDVALDDAGVRQRWRQRFVGPIEQAEARLAAAGVRVLRMRADAPSDDVLALLVRRQSQVA
jgi:uncharacterized protein (DUF58 family)